MSIWKKLFGGSKKPQPTAEELAIEAAQAKCKHENVTSHFSSSKCTDCGKIICFHHWAQHGSTQYRCMGCGEIRSK